MKSRRVLFALVLALVLCMMAGVAMAATEVSTSDELKAAVKVAGNHIILKNDITSFMDVDVSGVTIDLNTHTLTLGPSGGSNGTETNGARVLKNGSLTIKNGKITASTEKNTVGKNVIILMANYGSLTLEDVVITNLPSTVTYSINNRGNLTLKGNTVVPNGKEKAITNDPYNYVAGRDAVLNVADSKVVVGDVQLETYGSTGNPTGKVIINIENGTFGKFNVENWGEETKVSITGSIGGGTIQQGGALPNEISAIIAKDHYGVYDEKNNWTFMTEKEINEMLAAMNPVVPSLPQTGDESNIVLWAAMMALSAAAFVVLSKKARFN